MRLLALVALALGLAITEAGAAGVRLIDVPAGAEAPALHGAMWSPCAVAPAEPGRGVKDCPVSGERLPLVVISHGRGGTFNGHQDTASALANGGFVVAAINHPGDTATDMSRSGDLSVLVERPTDIRRLVDFMLSVSPAAGAIDRDRIGVFGFSRGGYTGLVLLGANPDWPYAAARCEGTARHVCGQIRNKEYPDKPLTHDPRVKAAVIADPLTVLFTAQSFEAVKAPVQLWASESGGDGVEPEAVAAATRNLPVPHEYHVVPNSRHFAFLTPCPAKLAEKRPELCTDPPGFDRVAFHRRLNADMLAFFRRYLVPP